MVETAAANALISSHLDLSVNSLLVWMYVVAKMTYDDTLSVCCLFSILSHHLAYTLYLLQ